jgi:hypothetical protein
MWFTSLNLQAAIKAPQVPIKSVLESARETVGLHPFDAILESLGPVEATYNELPVTTKKEVLTRTQIIVDVVKLYNGKSWNLHNSDPIGNLLKLILEGGSGKSNRREGALVARSIAECLIEQILACDESGDKVLL